MPRERAKERDCEANIKKTLAYSAVFKYPLSYYQLTTYLMGKREYAYFFFNKQLRRLLKNKHIGVEKEKFFMLGNKPVSWQTRYKISKDIITKTKESLQALEGVPWIKMIAITGSVAAHNADKDSDVDIFIISQKNRLWITRLLTFLYLKILNLYPKTDGEIGKVCANLYMDEDNLAWPRDKRSVYIAHDIARMQPIFHRDNVYFRFMTANKWINDFLPNFKFEQIEKTKPWVKGHSFIVNFIENILMHLQLAYMKKHKTNEITKKHLIHFNKNDNSAKILNEFSDHLGKVS
ncbi:nucleotidyltransferase domain-containing protein [candidate division WWE3 bacterium]|uniref:Nucleotidyltransferase domain-containing protein n=1 Tax=candidate division WWE3 bacterium TaxID=2053526 RepID=A0A7X9HGU1_UNCKA|nr:nucleotidyltransferase domain-containing protein [candidate division WWE3 bacterium]